MKQSCNEYNRGIPYKIIFNDRELKRIYQYKKISYGDLPEEGNALIDANDFSLILIRDGTNIIVFCKSLCTPMIHQTGMPVDKSDEYANFKKNTPKTWMIKHYAYVITRGAILIRNDIYCIGKEDPYNIGKTYLAGNYCNLTMLTISCNFKTLFSGLTYTLNPKNSSRIGIWCDIKRGDYDLWINASVYKFLLIEDILINALIPYELNGILREFYVRKTQHSHLQ
jgi:hypothetical protein